MSTKRKWDSSKVYRTTKCFSASGGTRKNGIKYPGQFPNGFIKWIKEMNWWGNERVYLCSGPVDDPNAIRVDVQPSVNPTHLEDARNTSLNNNSCNLVIIDPPYSKELAEELYGTEEHWSWINAFTKEAVRIVRPGGLIITLTYEIPRRISECDFIAVVGVYTTPMTGYMRCLTVSRKIFEVPLPPAVK